MKTRHTGRRWIVLLVCLLAWAGAPTIASAELEFDHDGRLEGYGSDSKVMLEDSNLTLPWLGFALVSAIALLGMFKDAKRSHLD